MLSGKRIAIFVEDSFADLELIEPIRAMKAANARVIIVGTGSRQSYQSKSGKRKITAEMAADRAKAEDFDAIIISASHAMDGMLFYQSMVEMVRQANGMGKVIAAICHGPRILIPAGIVRGRRMTSWHSIAVDLRNAGADWVDEPVVRDGNIITSRKPADMPMFDRVIIDAVAANSHSTGSPRQGEYRIPLCPSIEQEVQEQYLG